MKPWDLQGGAARIELALRSLVETGAEIGESWDDPTFHHFVAEYVTPLEPRVKDALDAIHRLAEALANAQRECSDEAR